MSQPTGFLKVIKGKKTYESPKLTRFGSLESFIEIEPSEELRKAALDLAEQARKARTPEKGD